MSEPTSPTTTGTAVLRRLAGAASAVLDACDTLDDDGAALAWSAYHRQIGIISEHLDESSLREFEAVVAPSGTGGASSVRVSLAALAGWLHGHVGYLDTVAAADALRRQLDQAIAAEVDRFDTERALAEDRSYHGTYV